MLIYKYLNLIKKGLNLSNLIIHFTNSSLSQAFHERFFLENVTVSVSRFVLSLLLPPAYITAGWREINDGPRCAGSLSDTAPTEGQSLCCQATYFMSCFPCLNMIFYPTFDPLLGGLLTRVLHARSVNLTGKL